MYYSREVTKREAGNMSWLIQDVQYKHHPRPHNFARVEDQILQNGYTLNPSRIILLATFKEGKIFAYSVDYRLSRGMVEKISIIFATVEIKVPTSCFPSPPPPTPQEKKKKNYPGSFFQLINICIRI